MFNQKHPPRLRNKVLPCRSGSEVDAYNLRMREFFGHTCRPVRHPLELNNRSSKVRSDQTPPPHPLCTIVM